LASMFAHELRSRLPIEEIGSPPPPTWHACARSSPVRPAANSVLITGGAGAGDVHAYSIL
jgi:hypothetical protein